MLVDVVMPQLGESVVEGTVLKWLVRPGDAVAKDQPLLEISTDKVDAEIPSPIAGVVTALLAKEGDVVPVLAVIARIESGAALAAAAGSLSPPAPAPGKSEIWDEEKEGMPAWIARRSAAMPPLPAAPAVAPRASPPPAQAAGARIRITPVVARMAAEQGIDLSRISGSGIDGRVTKKDLEGYLAGSNGKSPAAPTAISFAPPAPAPDSKPALADTPVIPPAASTSTAEDRAVPFTVIQKKMAERMVLSKRISPHVHAVAEVDMHRVMAFRAARRAEGVSLTMLPFVMSAAVRALREYPILNASVSGESVVYHGAIHLGVAVETERGLLVPVVRNADRMSLGSLSSAVEGLAGRARERKITPDELVGGTFTVSNPGPKGNLFGTPILNQPQTGILRMGQVVKRPVVVETEGADAIVARPMMYLVLGYDHRVVDGIAGNGFLFRVRELLEAGEFSL